VHVRNIYVSGIRLRIENVFILDMPKIKIINDIISVSGSIKSESIIKCLMVNIIAAKQQYSIINSNVRINNSIIIIVFVYIKNVINFIITIKQRTCR